MLDESGESIVSVRVALCAVGPTPMFVPEIGDALAGQPITEKLLEKAASLARDAAQPIDDIRGTAEFRKHITAVLTERVLRTAIARAKQKGI